MHHYGLDLKGQPDTKAFNVKRLGKIPREASVFFFRKHWFRTRGVYHYSPKRVSILFIVMRSELALVSIDRGGRKPYSGKRGESSQATRV